MRARNTGLLGRSDTRAADASDPSAFAHATALAGLVTAAEILATAGLARADEGDPTEGAAAGTSAAEDRAASFVAVEGSEAESVSGGALLVGAYGVVFTLLLGYVLWLGALSAGASREIARLSRAIASRSAEGGGASRCAEGGGASVPEESRKAGSDEG